MKTRLHFKSIVLCSIAIFTVGFLTTAYSQVAGISASKAGSYCVGTVPAKDLEFEPSFGFGKSHQKWNSDNKLENSFSSSDSAESYAEFAVRCTYGLTEKLEIGMAAPADVSGVSFGAKFIAFENDKNGIAIISGLNLPLGNRTYNLNSNDPHDISSLAGGFVFSREFSEKLLFDFDLQGQTLLKDAKWNTHYDLFINSDFGYYINDHTQLICGLSYYYNFYKDPKSDNSLLDIHPGISYETGDNFLIVLSSPFGLYGKNETQSYGVNIAFTMTIR